jgi:acyl-CoA synthetase (AMP-forming)/AMP-acid ligase II
VILGDVIERNALLYKDDLAIEFEGRRFTHGEFLSRVRRLANALADRGVKHQDRIAVLSENCSEYLDVYGAGELAGFITVTVNYRLAPPEMTWLLGDSAPTVLFFGIDYAETVRKLMPTIPSVTRYVSIGGKVDFAEEFETLLASAAARPPPFRATEDDTAYLIYTSGTTGRPKGVMIGQKQQVLSAWNMAVEGTIDATDSILLTTPLYHAGAKWVQLAHQWRGCAVHLLRSFEPPKVLSEIQRHRITATLLPATMLQAVMDQPTFKDADLSCLRTVYYSAAPMPVALLRRAIDALGPIFIQFYGLTEAGGTGTSLYKHHHVLDGDPAWVARLASAGQAKTCCEVRVVRDDGTDCDLDEAGEIIIRNPTLMQGYWNNPEATKEALQGGWLHTGDIGKFDAGRFLYVVDRKKDMIVSGGVNIYSREVEDALHHHPAVREAAVIGVPDAQWGESIHAYIVLKPGSAATPEELQKHCQTQIASFKKPKSFDFVATLPKLPNGKINKVELREPYWKGQARRVN